MTNRYDQQVAAQLAILKKLKLTVHIPIKGPIRFEKKTDD